MQYDDFVGQVQRQARLESTGKTVRTIHATLVTLGERLTQDEVDDLAAQLPDGIAAYLHEAETDEAFSLEEFFNRVVERTGIDLPEAMHHARAVFAVLDAAVTAGEMDDVRAQLPEDYSLLFEG